MPRVKVIGLGQPAAGDDGVGWAVVDALRQDRHANDLELMTLSDASDLLSALDGCDRVLLVDAILSPPAGRILEVAPEELSSLESHASTHGVGVASALELARLFAPDRTTAIRIVAVTIACAGRYREGLSPEVWRAVPDAAAHILGLAREGPSATEAWR